MQEKYLFRFPLPALLARRSDKDNTRYTGDLLTDDFAPVSVYDKIGQRRRGKLINPSDRNESRPAQE